MRPIHTASMDKTRPVLVLTRTSVRSRLNTVTVATITTTARGLTSEVPVGPANGLEMHSVVNCDTVQTIPHGALGPQIGRLLPRQEAALSAAIRAAFDLD